MWPIAGSCNHQQLVMGCRILCTFQRAHAWRHFCSGLNSKLVHTQQQLHFAWHSRSDFLWEEMKPLAETSLNARSEGGANTGYWCAERGDEGANWWKKSWEIRPYLSWRDYTIQRVNSAHDLRLVLNFKLPICHESITKKPLKRSYCALTLINWRNNDHDNYPHSYEEYGSMDRHLKQV